MGKPAVLSRNREEELLNRLTVGEKREIGNRISGDSQISDLAQWMIVSLTKQGVHIWSKCMDLFNVRLTISVELADIWMCLCVVLQEYSQYLVLMTNLGILHD